MGFFDAIVVGAGAAGCVAARRLADDGRRVLLCEAGPAVPDQSIRSVDALQALGHPGWQWPNVYADAGPGGPLVPYRQGRGLGGSTAINTLVATPGDRNDYQRWADTFGCPGWDWTSMAPWFALANRQLRPVVAAARGPLAAAIAPVALAAGHEVGGVSAELDAVGFLDASLFVGRDGRRSGSDAYLGSKGHNPHILADRSVHHVMVEQGRVVGVELAGGLRVDTERVVLAAGALNSPRLLYRSGILGRYGATRRPVEDHPSFVFTVLLRSRKAELEARDGSSQAAPISALLRWRSSPASPASPASGRGGGVGGGSGAGAMDAGANDLMALVIDDVGPAADGRRYGAVIVTLTDVASRGELVASDRHMRFRPGWLVDAHDRHRLGVGVRHIAALLSADEASSSIEGVFIDDRGTPIDALQAMTNREVEQWLVDHPGPVAHVGATLALGDSSASIVDLNGAVRGCQGLNVIDASVLPHLPNANLQLPVTAVAERLTAAILAAG